jgi:branched-chain amino acid transport system ATP-binding protein
MKETSSANRQKLVPMREGKTLLRVEGLRSGYGQKQVLNGVSLHVNEGEIVALLGPNGAGKSTVLKTIFGLLRAWEGVVMWNGVAIQNRRPAQNVRDGLAYVPQGSRVFADLTVQENLEVGGFILRDRWQIRECMEQVFRLFPILAERRQQLAGKLSGGERQMLALGKALMAQPRLLLLDEPSLGLAPQVTREALNIIKRLNSELGTAILLVEQNVREALTIAHRVYVLRVGEVVLEAQSHDLTLDILRSAFLGKTYG